ncbi:ABC transporter permease [Streptomyces sp. NPDC050504]|uniref:ABC transporter permease n=1 Tax=Streptomyces sp. NPDC050504 TaxID=3365618 RepID=UPI0037A5B248
MTLLDQRKDAPLNPAPAPVPVPASRFSLWLRDLGLGVRFAAKGGREGWVRTVLTAVGVGLGVAVLLAATGVPNLIDNRSQRNVARSPSLSGTGAPVTKAGDTTFIVADASVDYRDDTIGGHQLRAEGEHPVLPPGVSRFPGPGEMVVSPALKEKLEAADGELLRERFKPYKIIGTIGEAGLTDPYDLYLYLGSDTLAEGPNGMKRGVGWGYDAPSDPMNPALVILVVLMCVVLLVPVAIFVATAVRFGGERRDRRLAALRLVGADIATTKRAAAGEALFGTLLGLLAGAVFFYGGRELIGSFQVWSFAAFPSDLQPSPALAALIMVAVPVCSIAVTLLALRTVSIEPLGVVRQGKERVRRVAWRLPMPVIGVGLLLTADTSGYDVSPMTMASVSLGIVLVLVGLVTLLPWLVETVVLRMRGGPVPWQLATRRLQLSSAAASRAVSGITVAVAGGIALQMYFVGVNDDFTEVTGQDTDRAQMGTYSNTGSGELAERTVKALRATKGVKDVRGSVNIDTAVLGSKAADGSYLAIPIKYGSCADFRELLTLSSCKDGDAFLAYEPKDKSEEWVKAARPGRTLDLNPYSDVPDQADPIPWKIPKNVRTVPQRVDPSGDKQSGLFVTTSAIDPLKARAATTAMHIKTDPSVPDAADRVRNVVYGIDPATSIYTYATTQRDKQYEAVRTSLFVGATATLLLIAASMVVAQIEQLRERKRLLSVLVAFGTRRATLAWSVLWQTAIPVVLATAIATVGGLGLGWAMLKLVDRQVTDWLLFLPLTAIGAGLIAAVTLFSMPSLWRMMRPEGLRTE